MKLCMFALKNVNKERQKRQQILQMRGWKDALNAINNINVSKSVVFCTFY